MNHAWRLGLLLTLAPVGCAHQTAALAPGGPAISRGATGAPGNGAPESVAPREEASTVASQADPVINEGAAAAGPAVGESAAGKDPAAGGSPAVADCRDAEPAAEDDLDILDTPSAPVADPLAPWNRTMFLFNDKFYFWFLKPVACGYRAVVPGPARTGVDNFINNLWAPKRFISNLLQFKGREATIELGKFMINSTWGVLGFGNLFKNNPETTIPEADLGLAFARWGVGGGTYIVWPFFGSFTMRDTVGALGGLLLDPISYLKPLSLSIGGRAFTMVDYTSFRIGDYEALKDASIDPYLALRDAYLQHRAERVKE